MTGFNWVSYAAALNPLPDSVGFRRRLRDSGWRLADPAIDILKISRLQIHSRKSYVDFSLKKMPICYFPFVNFTKGK